MVRPTFLQAIWHNAIVLVFSRKYAVLYVFERAGRAGWAGFLFMKSISMRWRHLLIINAGKIKSCDFISIKYRRFDALKSISVQVQKHQPHESTRGVERAPDFSQGMIDPIILMHVHIIAYYLMSKYIHRNHSVFNIGFHLIFSSKYRKPYLSRYEEDLKHFL